jgi:type III secretion protein L
MIESVQTDPESPLWYQGSRLLLAADGARLTDSAQILEQARARAERIVREAEENAGRIREQARQEGWTEGRNAAAARHIETVTGALRYFDSIESSFADLVAESVRAILADIPPAERIRQLARKAVETLRQQTKITFRVNPQDLETAAPALADLKSLLPAGAEIIVTSSEEVPLGGVYVESALGIIDASLETQLANLKGCLSAGRS